MEADVPAQGPPTLERPPTLDPLPTRDPPPPEMSDTLDFLADCQRKQELFQAALNGEVFLGNEPSTEPAEPPPDEEELAGDTGGPPADTGGSGGEAATLSARNPLKASPGSGKSEEPRKPTAKAARGAAKLPKSASVPAIPAKEGRPRGE